MVAKCTVEIFLFNLHEIVKITFPRIKFISDFADKFSSICVHISSQFQSSFRTTQYKLQIIKIASNENSVVLLMSVILGALPLKCAALIAGIKQGNLDL